MTWRRKTKMREFETGATRDSDNTKLDYDGFLSPLVLKRYAQYMNKNRIQRDGTPRESDNWQKGIPLTVYMKSGWRHFMDWWSLHRQEVAVDSDELEEELCAILFNVMGYLHEYLKPKQLVDSSILPVSKISILSDSKICTSLDKSLSKLEDQIWGTSSEKTSGDTE